MSPAGVESSTARMLASLRDQLTSAEVEAELFEAQLAPLKEAQVGETGRPPELELEAQIVADPGLRQRKEEIIQLENTWAGIKQVAPKGEDDPRCQELRAEIRQMEEDLNAEALAKLAQSRQ